MFFSKLLCSTIKPPTLYCFPFISCLFMIIVQSLFHLWKPRSFDLLSRFWLTRLSSRLSHSLMRFLYKLAEEIFLPFSKVHCVTDNLNSRVYDFLSAFFILNKRHATPRKHSKSKTFEMRMLNLIWWHSNALALGVEKMASCSVKLAKMNSTIKVAISTLSPRVLEEPWNAPSSQLINAAATQ